MFVDRNLAGPVLRAEPTLSHAERSNTLVFFIFTIKQVVTGAPAAKPWQKATQAGISS